MLPAPDSVDRLQLWRQAVVLPQQHNNDVEMQFSCHVRTIALFSPSVTLNAAYLVFTHRCLRISTVAYIHNPANEGTNSIE